MSIFGGARAGRLISQLDDLLELDDAQNRKHLVKLHGLGPAGVKRLLESLETADQSRAKFLSEVLAQIISDKTLDQAVKGLISDNQRVVTATTWALGHGKRFSANRLLDYLKKDDLPKAPLCDALARQRERLDVRRVLTQAYLQDSTEKAILFRIVAESAGEADVPELISRLSGRDVVARAHIIDILSGFDKPEVYEALQAQLKDSNKMIRQSAINALGKMSGTPDIELLCELLCDPDLDVQNKAVDVIVKQRHPDTVRHLIVALKDDSEYARRAAVEVLNEIADPRSIKDLLEAIGDDDWWVRARATDALAKIGGPRVVDAVIRLINDENEDIRRAAIELLNSTRDERAVKKLVEATEDDDWWVRERAADALAEIGDTRGLPALEKMLDGDTRSIPTAIRGLAKIGEERHVPKLLRLIEHPERDIKVEAMHALSRLADQSQAQDIRDRVGQYLGSDDKVLRQAAIATVKSIDERFSPSQIREQERAERFAEPTRTLLMDDKDVGALMRGGVSGGGPVQKQLDITTLEAGDIIEGRYKYVRKIGKGAFGTVLLVTDQVVEENLILKFLNPNVASDEEMMKRFVHELRYSRKITHKNVIRIYDFLFMGGLYAISMEYFPSHTLGDEVKDEQPLPIEKALNFGCDIATGMDVAHHAGIVHRDLKPANILINDEGLLKIVDFGVAAARSSGDTQLTKTGYVIGSPKYMAPEQILGKQVDETADIYSLGVIMYEMLTGIPPYSKGDHMSVMYQHVQGKAKRARDVNEALPEELSECIMTCMAVDKNKRYASMEEVKEMFERFLPTES
jgi:serine/threonine-protein kinase